MSGDEDQEYFVDGMTEDLITDLSKVSELFVIARNSSFAYKGKSPDLRQVGQELGVRHILEGSVRRVGNQVRINAQLIDAQTGGHLWAERYDGDLENIFALQDEITAEIVGALKVSLTASDRDRTKATPDLEAYDLFLRARAVMYPTSKAANEIGRPLLEKAIAADPNFADAHALLGYIEYCDWIFAWNNDASYDQALLIGRRAVELDDKSALGHARLGFSLLCGKRFDEGVAELNYAVELQPNDPEGHAWLGEAQNYLGTPERTAGYSMVAMRLNPHWPTIGIHLGHSSYLLGHLEAAAATLEEAVVRASGHPIPRMLLAVIYAELGRQDEASSQIERLRNIAPGLTLEIIQGRWPYKSEAILNRLVEGLRKAGLSE